MHWACIAAEDSCKVGMRFATTLVVLVSLIMSSRQANKAGQGSHLAGDVPGLGPAQLVLIHQHPHQLWHCDGGVCVIQLEGHLLGKLVKVGVRLLPPPHHILQHHAISDLDVSSMYQQSVRRGKSGIISSIGWSKPLTACDVASSPPSTTKFQTRALQWHQAPGELKARLRHVGADCHSREGEVEGGTADRPCIVHSPA